MKKITLSAAIVALAMMGCSESGLDNSVASTSEVTDVQNLYSADFVPVLKKYNSTLTCSDFSELCIESTPESNHHSNMIWISSHVSGRTGSGKIWITKWKNPNNGAKSLNQYVDMLHVYTVCVRDCDANGNCLEHSNIAEYHNPKQFLAMTSDNKIQWHEVQCNVKGNGRVGTVSNYAAVLNAGTPDELVMMGSTYSGLDNEYQALRVYQNYLAAPLQNQ